MSFLKMLRNQNFNQRLPGNTQTTGLFIERLNHPDRKIHIDPLLLLLGPPGFGKVQILSNILSGLKFCIKIFSFHIRQPPYRKQSRSTYVSKIDTGFFKNSDRHKCSLGGGAPIFTMSMNPVPFVLASEIGPA